MYFIQSLLVFASLSRIVLSDPYTISLGDISTYAVTVVCLIIVENSALPKRSLTI
jgi:hypothetical protein